MPEQDEPYTMPGPGKPCIENSDHSVFVMFFSGIILIAFAALAVIGTVEANRSSREMALCGPARAQAIMERQ